MELELIGLSMNFFGTILLLLFLDPVVTNEKIRDGKEKIPKEKVVKKYLVKKYFALIIIIVGFIIQLISSLCKK